jgi:hypothetical protein
VGRGAGLAQQFEHGAHVLEAGEHQLSAIGWDVEPGAFGEHIEFHSKFGIGHGSLLRKGATNLQKAQAKGMKVFCFFFSKKKFFL